MTTICARIIHWELLYLLLCNIVGSDAFIGPSILERSALLGGGGQHYGTTIHLDALATSRRSRKPQLISSRTTPVAKNVSSRNNREEDEEGEEDDKNSKREKRRFTVKKTPRWDKLDGKVKERIVTAAQERAVENKKKREPVQDKKRRLLMYVKQKQQERKRSSRIERPLAFDKRTPLSALIPGMEMRGLVISLTKFGAYVDVGTECDGLLHVSQFSHDAFVEHPRQVVTPGQEVLVRVRSLSAPLKKLHLTMLPRALVEAEEQEMLQVAKAGGISDRIPLQQMLVDDELWGELRRVTDYGAYVEVGAMVDAWLHFMDHPSWQRGSHPREFMKAGDRVRVWVADIDLERQRIKVTAHRPPHLPGPRREFASY